MTRKHFEAVAATIAELKISAADRVHVASKLAAVFITLNPRFDARRFLAACGVEVSDRRITTTKEA